MLHFLCESDEANRILIEPLAKVGKNAA